MSTVLSASTSRLAHEAARHHKLWADRLHLRVNQLVAAVLLLGLSPLMLGVALLIWRCDGTPILFGQYRVRRTAVCFVA